MQRRVGGLRALASLLHAQPGEQLSRSLRGLHASTSASAATGFAPGTTKPTPRNGVDPPYVAKLSANRPAPVIMEEMEPSEPAVRALAYVGAMARAVCDSRGGGGGGCPSWWAGRCAARTAVQLSVVPTRVQSRPIRVGREEPLTKKAGRRRDKLECVSLR
jgi:hypothetical protein